MSQSKINVLAMSEYEDSRGEKKTRWRRIGVAFENEREDTPGRVGRNGGSLTLLIDALPLSAFSGGELRLQLRADDDDDRSTDNDRGGDRGNRNRR